MTEKEKDKLLYGELPSHDIAACNALKEYDELCKPSDELMEQRKRGLLDHNVSIKFPSMQAIADKYNTTIKAMKEHWPCIEK